MIKRPDMFKGGDVGWLDSTLLRLQRTPGFVGYPLPVFVPRVLVMSR